MTDKKLDSLLSAWPMPERAPMDVDEAADRVLEAVRAGQKPLRSAAIDDAALLSPPLPQRPEEGQTSPRTGQHVAPGRVTQGIAVENKMAKDRGRDRSSFQELAKLASMPPSAMTPTPPPTSAASSGPTGVVRGEEASSDDSGIVDLKAIATADPAAAQRAQATPLAAQGLFDEEAAPPASATLPAHAAGPAVASATPATASVPPAAASAKPAPTEKKKGGGGAIVIALGAIVALGAVAAGGFFVLRARAHANSEAAVAARTVAAPDTAQGAATATAAAAGAGSVAEATPSASTDNALDLGDLPEDSPQKARLRKITATSGAKAAATTASNDKPPPAASVDPKLIANIPTGGGGSGSSGDFNDALKSAAGGGTGLGKNTQTAAAGPTGDVPQKPPQGQVVGAIAQVLPSARSCVNEGDPISRSTVVFGSSGAVKSVSVSGFAAGKPAEACIKAALGKAKVSPFAEPSYSFPVTIRSN